MTDACERDFSPDPPGDVLEQVSYLTHRIVRTIQPSP